MIRLRTGLPEKIWRTGWARVIMARGSVASGKWQVKSGK
jgi:hypothetical protein